MKNVLKRLTAFSFVLFLSVAVMSNITTAQNNPPTQGSAETVVDKVNANDNTSEFATLLDASGFAKVLQKPGPYTVLAPSNEALKSADVNLDEAKQNRKQAQQVVQNHLYQGELSSGKVESSMGVGVKDTDDSASNGTIHIVDGVVQK